SGSMQRASPGNRVTCGDDMTYRHMSAVSLLIALLSTFVQAHAGSPAANEGSSTTPTDTPNEDGAHSNQSSTKGAAHGQTEKKGMPQVLVEGERYRPNPVRLDHSLSEVDGPTITVTKKTTVVN